MIGDHAHPLILYCMKEYQTCLENKQVVFNNLLRSARNKIECFWETQGKMEGTNKNCRFKI